jgi:biotin carboxyl carrier protein
MATKIELETGGTVWKLLTVEGDAVEEGQTLFIMEVMKMEVSYEAPTAGVVACLKIAEGDVLQEGEIAMEIA